MKKMKLTRKLMAACSIVALSTVMYGCGGGGSENDLIATEDALEDVRAERDVAQARVKELEGDVSDLNLQISNPDPANPGLTEQLTAKQGQVHDLNLQINNTDPADPGLMQQLATLRLQISNPDPANPGLTEQLATKQDEVVRLTTELGTVKETNTSLRDGTAPELLDPVKTGASVASTGADVASTGADDAAGVAEAAAENRATIQTGEANSVEHAAAARTYATVAAEQATLAADASAKAQDAENETDADEFKDIAVAAQKLAEEAQANAETERDEAVADSMVELKIDGTMKSVGDLSVDADAPNNVVTTGTGADRKTVDTGLQGVDNPELTVPAVPGAAFIPNVAPTADTAYEQAVEARTFDTGKVVDSADDMARLTIVTQYAGSRNVRVYADNAGAADEIATRAGMMSVLDGIDGVRNTDDDTYVALRSEGTYLPVNNAGGDANELEAQDVVLSDAEGETVFSFLDVGPDGAVGGGDDVRVFVVLFETGQITGGTTTYTYDVVDVDAMASDATTDGIPEPVQVTASIPEATDYNHIHFGVWAALDEDGESPSGHGIGFVQNYSDGGMTAVMPNFGEAEFNGNWVATVQVADPDGNGAISLQDGAATLMADWEDGDITVTLAGLAVLEGDVSGNTFSGDEATVGANALSLTADADFDGSFEGAFFGTGAAEAGGVFDFGSDDDNEDGAFRGSFGGAR